MNDTTILASILREARRYGIILAAGTRIIAIPPDLSTDGVLAASAGNAHEAN
jgi:hypothetical protein